MEALVGYTGFVGSNLARQHKFDDFYNSKNIETISGKHYELIACAAAPAEKWKANKDPEKDRESINKLCNALTSVTADRFILISTIDVYPAPVDVDEDSAIQATKCEPYGRHRLELEQFAKDQFNAIIVRLPGLFGTGLKKNIIYDYLNNNSLDQVNTKAVFQFYNLAHLWDDLQIVQKNGLMLVNFSTEPTGVAEIFRDCFNVEYENDPGNKPGYYDFRSKYAELFGGEGGYLYSKGQVINELREFANIELAKQGK